jgi:ABC-type branched-subunit amino acid transport system substrate-binding protein
VRIPTRPLAIAVAVVFYAGLATIAAEGAFDDGSGTTQLGTAGAPGLATTGGGTDTAAGPVPAGAGGGTGTGATGATRPGGPPATGAAPTAGGGANPGATPGAPAGGGHAPAGGGRVVPTEPLRIGLRIGSQASTSAMAAALGARGVSGGNQRGYAEALVAHLNATGGIDGRTVEAVYREVDIAGLVANSDASDQADCEHFTDAEVSAVLSPLPLGAPLGPCLASRGIPLVVASPEEFNDNDLARLGGMMSLPATPSLHRQADIIIGSLAQQGFYDGATVGLVWYDKPTFREAIEEAFRPAFAAHGVTVAEEVVMSSYTSSEQFSSAVLRFKARGITHVQFVDVSGLLALQFMQYAETQQYRPRYGLSSANSLSAVQTAVSPNQLRGAIGVGWMPSLDTSEHPGFSATAQGCLDALRADGQRTGDRVAVALALWTCETLSFFRAAMELAPEHSAAGFVAGLAAIGDGYVPADTFAVRVGPGRYDGPAAVRPLAYDDGCSCFRYTGEPYGV